MIRHILTSWFKTFDSTKNTEGTKKIKLWKTSFSKEIVENADLHKPV